MTPADSTLADPSGGAVWCGTSRPILFSGEMVKAILAGQKTQTRRIVRDGQLHVAKHHPLHGPYGKPGDRLWVREAHALETLDGDERVVYREGLAARWRGEGEKLFYLAKDDAPKRWRPSIHMPRWASRITLSITEVRVQRLHDITEDDARAEGVTSDAEALHALSHLRGQDATRAVPSRLFSARENFAALWESINGKRAPWASNPWIYAVTFSRVP